MMEEPAALRVLAVSTFPTHFETTKKQILSFLGTSKPMCKISEKHDTLKTWDTIKASLH